ncbi:myocardin-related transcription factor B-like isoform X2 [Varroa destructor]|uniref:SAP domain-containing protein n=1 Tax=Varroa destructor TaxID=109461 RepID=A0A7M7JG28_VARDE|nr:myocardin-related transcription factor B-like isoform X2 [Varroa destructor]
MDSQPATPMDASCLQAPSPAAPMEVVNSPQPGCSAFRDRDSPPQGSSTSGLLTGPSGIQDDDSLGSPPVDERSLHETLARNREKLKVKLLTRRPIHQLVQQGIIPPLKASPQFLEQKQRLERAKMGDFLKNKMQHRPDRDTLIRAHILEDTSAKLDPSLQDKQRRLKRARLKDDLNDRLAHRPGPLELIRGNILQADETFAQAIKEGTIPFKRTCEGDIVTPTEPISESGSDDSQQGSGDGGAGSRDGSPPQGAPTPLQVSTSASLVTPTVSSVIANSSTTTPTGTTSMHTPRLEAMNLANAVVGATATHTTPTTLLLTTTDGDGHSVIVCTQTENGAAGQAVVKTLSQSPAAIPSTPVYFTLATNPTRTPAAVGNSGPTLIKQRSLPTPVTLVSSQTATTPVPTGSKKKSSSSGKAAQTTPSQQPNKNRIIKFHEYKGPPSAMKDKEMKEKKETSYELLLQQQRVFLQWQMDHAPGNGSKQKMILPAPSSSFQTGAPINSDAYKLKCAKLEDMKVSDLKLELKKRNLTVSGSKPQLIERLKPFSDQIASTKPGTPSSIECASSNHSNINNCDTMIDDVSTPTVGEHDSVLAKMDILHKELLEKQRIQTLLQQQQQQQQQQLHQQMPATTTSQQQQANVITITDGSGKDQTIQVNRVLCQPGVQIIHAKPQLVALQVTKSSDAAHCVDGGMLNVSGLAGSPNIAIVSQVASSSGETSATTLQKMSPQHIQVKHVVPTTVATPSLGASHVIGQLTKPMGQLQPIQVQHNGGVQVKQVSGSKQAVQAGKVQPVHVKVQPSGQHLQQQQQQQPQPLTTGQLKLSTLPKQLLQHKILPQPASIVASSVGANTSISAGPASPVLKNTSVERKPSSSQDGARSHTRTHSLPCHMDVLPRKPPPEYTEMTRQIQEHQQQQQSTKESCDMNLNDIFEIISKQEQPAQFEVTRNPDTGVIMLKEATADTPKTSHIVTPDIKAPVVIEGLSVPIAVASQDMLKPLEQKSATERQVGISLNSEKLQTTVLKSNLVMAQTRGVQDHAESLPSVPNARTSDDNSQSTQSFKGTLSTLVKSKQSLQNVQGAIETTSVDSCKGDPQVRAHEDKALDFNVDLDALETLDINFDIIHQDNNNKHSNQHLFKNFSLEPEHMSTDFGQDLDWWSNELFQTKQSTTGDTRPTDQLPSDGNNSTSALLITTSVPNQALVHNEPTHSSSDSLRTPEITPSLSLNDPLLSFSNTNNCTLTDHKAASSIHNSNNNNALSGAGFSQPLSHHPPAISLYSDMQGLLCEDVIMADWTNAQPHSFDIHMQM